jgi:hypothetical protein
MVAMKMIDTNRWAHVLMGLACVCMLACGGGSSSEPTNTDTTDPTPDTNPPEPDTAPPPPVDTVTPPQDDGPPPTPDVGDPEQEVDLGISCKASGNDCPDGSYCKANGCSTKAQGSCTIPPMICPDELSPVCTCNEETFDSPCIAGMAHQNVESMQACDSGGIVCLVGMNTMCPQGTYCDGTCWQNGICKPVASNCEEKNQVVCGCDGVIYPNPCTANASSVSVWHEGACITEEGIACAGMTGQVCGEGQKCNIEACDEYWPGQCKSTEDCESTPQCGCDNVTYQNVCERLEADVAKYHDGPCLPGGDLPTCTGSVANSGKCGQDYWQDGASYYCDKWPPGECEFEGVCTARPASCEGLQWPEVCGCDDQTYTNLCVARQHDMPAQSPGACP